MCCACDPSVQLGVTSSNRVYLYLCMLEIISSFRSWRAGSQVFDLLMLFICVILYTMWSSNIAVAEHLTLWYIVFVCLQYDACDNYIGSVYALEKKFPVGFLVVCTSSSALFQSLVMSYVDYDDDGWVVR